MPTRDERLTFHGNIEQNGDHLEVDLEGQEQGLVEHLGHNLGTFPYPRGVQQYDDQQPDTAYKRSCCWRITMLSKHWANSRTTHYAARTSVLPTGQS